MGGRRSEGSRLVYRVTGSPAAQQRGEVLLELLARNLTIHEAGAQLDLGQARVNVLRRDVVSAVVEALEPRPSGRPSRPVDERDTEIQQLRSRVAELEHEVKVLSLKTELQTALPQCAAEPPSEKKRSRRRNPPGNRQRNTRARRKKGRGKAKRP